MTSADFCPITFTVASECALRFPGAPRQTDLSGYGRVPSPHNRILYRMRCTTGLRCLVPARPAHSASYDLLVHPPATLCVALRAGRLAISPSGLPLRCSRQAEARLDSLDSFPSNLTITPLPSACTFVFIVLCTEDFHLIGSRPCRAYTKVVCEPSYLGSAATGRSNKENADKTF